MSDTLPEASPETTESTESFDQILAQFERTNSHKAADPASNQLSGTVVSITADSVLVDIGYKSEGILPLLLFADSKSLPAVGDRLLVTSKGRNPEGYYDLSLQRVAQPRDISALEVAFADQSIVEGTVTALVKGGLTIDIGVRAFCPSSRSGTRDAAELAALVGQTVRCRILKLEKESDDSIDVVVDRRSVLEEEQAATKDRRYAELREGDIVSGTVRSLTDYGAFIELGGTDGLLHISDIAWTRIASPAEVLTVGDSLDLKILKIDPATRRIGLGLKQLQPHPWQTVPDRFKVGDRVRGSVSRLMDFGAFIELAPGVEGMIHVSEMSWAKKVRKPEDMLKLGDTVEAVILSIQLDTERIALGLKQALGDPWADAAARFPIGSTVTGPVSSLTKFGAFITLSEGIEGLIHVSEMVKPNVSEKRTAAPAAFSLEAAPRSDDRIARPQDVLRLGQVVQTKVLDLDPTKRQARLSMKQLVPTGLDEYLAEHKPGDIVTARIISIANGQARVELGEGIHAICTLPVAATQEASAPTASLDLSAFSSMLNAKWKGAASAKPGTEIPQPGQIRNFRLLTLDPESKHIAVALIP